MSFMQSKFMRSGRGYATASAHRSLDVQRRLADKIPTGFETHVDNHRHNPAATPLTDPHRRRSG
jgi:hypothetical protein